MTIKTKKYLCPKCFRELDFKSENVSEGYFGACLNCDEDFYKIEVEVIKE